MPKRLVSSFSKLGILYAYFLILFFAGSNFINLNSDHKNISFTHKKSFTEILDVNKLIIIIIIVIITIIIIIIIIIPYKNMRYKIAKERG